MFNKVSILNSELHAPLIREHFPLLICSGVIVDFDTVTWIDRRCDILPVGKSMIPAYLAT